MFRNLLFFILLSTPFVSLAQCKDSLTVDPYHYCGEPYQPVCGCDNITYRSPCAAQYWGGILNPGLLSSGVCANTNFDFDFVPNPVGSLSGGNSASHLHIFISPILFTTASTVSYSVYLLDIFNKVMYQRDATANEGDNIQGAGVDNGIAIGDFSSDYFAQFENGIYILIISVNGEQKTKKIVIENSR